MSWGLRATASSSQLGAGSHACDVACSGILAGKVVTPLSPRVCADSALSGLAASSKPQLLEAALSPQLMLAAPSDQLTAVSSARDQPSRVTRLTNPYPDAMPVAFAVVGLEGIIQRDAVEAKRTAHCHRQLAVFLRQPRAHAAGDRHAVDDQVGQLAAARRCHSAPASHRYGGAGAKVERTHRKPAA